MLRPYLLCPRSYSPSASRMWGGDMGSTFIRTPTARWMALAMAAGGGMRDRKSVV